MIFQLLRPIQEIINTPRRNTNEKEKEAVPVSETKDGAAAGVKKKSSNIILEKFILGTAINLVLVDDRIETGSGSTTAKKVQKQPMFTFGRKFDLSFNVSLELGKKEDEPSSPSCVGKELSVVIDRFLLKHCKQKGSIGSFMIEMKKASLLIEEKSQNVGNEFYVDVGSIAMNCDNAHETEYIIGLALFFQSSMKLILPKKKRIRQKPPIDQNKKKKSPFQCLAISCRTLDLGITVRCRENPDEEGGLRAKVDAHTLQLSLTPPNTVQHGELKTNGEAIVELASIVASFSFVPHQTFPSFVECVNQVVSKENRLIIEKRSQQKRVKYIFSGSSFSLYALLPSNKKSGVADSSQEELYFEVAVCDIFLREEMKLISPICRIQTHDLLRATASVHFVLQKAIK